MHITDKQHLASTWFRTLRDRICTEFETIETELTGTYSELPPGTFTRKRWEREHSEATHQESGKAQEAISNGGEISLMKGRVFEKVGVNISVVQGEFSEQFRKEIPGADKDPRFWASGISLVAHLRSPLVPAVHMNTRMIIVGTNEERRTTNDERENYDRAPCPSPLAPTLWFGGGADLNPIVEDAQDTEDFHAAFKATCDKADPSYYTKYKQWCDEYFWIKHRKEPRGAGGIFYDYLKTGDWQADFAFTRSVGETFLSIYPRIVRRQFNQPWTDEQRSHQLFKRGRYAEFNLVYDRGTRFGLMTGGNPEAVLMSLPPIATWD